MWDAFISHATTDKTAAERITKSLKKQRLQVWIDNKNIRGAHPLVPALQDAIKASRNIIVLWSEAASTSKWVATEWNAVVNFNHQKETTTEKGVIPCRWDDTPLDLFLLNYIFCDFRTSFETGMEQLLARLGGDIEPTPPPAPFRPSDFVQQIMAGQSDVLTALGGNDAATAQRKQADLNRLVDAALRQQPDDYYVLALAGYNKKNEYMIRHWDAIQANPLRPPKDGLLDEAGQFFFKVLSVRPDDPSALNGLGSVFMLQGELDAAEFYIKRSLARAREEGFDYPDAEHDLRLIEYLKKRKKS